MNSGSEVLLVVVVVVNTLNLDAYIYTYFVHISHDSYQTMLLS